VRRAIGPDETSEEIEHDLARMGASLLARTIDALVDGSIVETPQDDSTATYARRLTKEDGIIDWTRRALEIHNLIRGLHPWPHAFTFHRGRRMILLRSTLVPGPAGLPGAVLQSAGDHLHIATGDGALAISELQVEGRRPMTPREFLAGHRLTPGDILTPKP
jgi:methionyl-tRNA formyltransferase